VAVAAEQKYRTNKEYLDSKKLEMRRLILPLIAKRIKKSKMTICIILEMFSPTPESVDDTQ